MKSNFDKKVVKMKIIQVLPHMLQSNVSKLNQNLSKNLEFFRLQNVVFLIFRCTKFDSFYRQFRKGICSRERTYAVYIKFAVRAVVDFSDLSVKISNLRHKH